MKKNGKCGAKTGQEAAWCDLRGKVAFCRDNIGVEKVRVETFSHSDCCELAPQHFLFLSTDSLLSHQIICLNRAIKRGLDGCCSFGQDSRDPVGACDAVAGL